VLAQQQQDVIGTGKQQHLKLCIKSDTVRTRAHTRRHHRQPTANWLIKYVRARFLCRSEALSRLFYDQLTAEFYE
jgi:hypothetical protein